MKKTILFTCIAFLLSTTTFAQNLNDVYESMALEDWEVALDKLEPILSKKKKRPEALWLAAICHMHRYRFEQSFEYFKQSEDFAEIDPFYYVPL